MSLVRRVQSSNNQDIPIGFAPDIATLMRDLADMRDAGGAKEPAQDTNKFQTPRSKQGAGRGEANVVDYESVSFLRGPGA